MSENENEMVQSKKIMTQNSEQKRKGPHRCLNRSTHHGIFRKKVLCVEPTSSDLEKWGVIALTSDMDVGNSWFT